MSEDTTDRAKLKETTNLYLETNLKTETTKEEGTNLILYNAIVIITINQFNRLVITVGKLT